MRNIIKYFFYATLLSPQLVLAQVRSGQGKIGRPDILSAFLSISVFLYIILGAIGALSIIGFFLAAVDYLAAGGDEERVGRAGKIFGFSLAGIVIAAIGIILLNFAGRSITK